jgi:hypothetical protein
MIMNRAITFTAALAMTLTAACSDDSVTTPITNPPPPGSPTIVTATGDITAKVTDFRNLLGASNGGTAGEQAAGRREINWDGAGANPFNNRNDFPAAFFNTNVKSGAVFTTAGTGFRNDSTSFVDIDPSYANEFAFFSANKIFAPVGSNLVDQIFEVAGQPTPALVQSFGIVFSDVDVAETTSIQLFTKDGGDLGTYFAPVRSDAGGLSFIGVIFDTPKIARVRITLGTGALAAGVKDISAGGTLDLVVFDNVIYGEPKNAF